MKRKIILFVSILAFITLKVNAQWSLIASGITNPTVSALAISSGTNVFAGTNGGGVFFSNNNGANWSAANTGLTNLSVLSFAVSGTTVFAGTNGGGVFSSANNGGTTRNCYYA